MIIWYLKYTIFKLFRAYYDPKKGSRYTLGRVPIGCTDFSTRIYTYDDVPGDTLLKNFSLAPEDYNYKIPYAKLAIELNPEVLLFAAAWSAPLWMKQFDNNISTYDNNVLKLKFRKLKKKVIEQIFFFFFI